MRAEAEADAGGGPAFARRIIVRATARQAPWLPQLHREPRRTARHRLGADQDAHRLGAFDHPLQAKPGRKRQAPSASRWRFARVERDQPEIAGLQHQRERANRLLEGALIQIAAETGVGDDDGRGSTGSGRDRCRRPPPTRHRTCRARRPARRARRARVAAASIEMSRLKRPDDRGPTISDSWPRGNPPPRPRVDRWNAGRPAGVFGIRVGCRQRGGQRAVELTGAKQRFRGRRVQGPWLFSLFIRLKGRTITHARAAIK